MKRVWPAFIVLAIGAAGVAPSPPPAPNETTTISLPAAGPTLKPGPGVEMVQTYCTVCHAPAYVTIQPPLTAAQWAAEVGKMQHAYGAQIPDAAIDPIVRYLTAGYGTP